MPTGPLPPSDDYLGDGDRTTGEFQAELNNLQNWARQFQSQLDALSSTTPGEAFNRAVGTGATDLVQTSQLDTRLGTSGNLGDAAQRSVGLSANDVPELSAVDDVTIDTGDFSGDPFTLRCRKIGSVVTLTADQVSHPSSGGPSSGAGAIPAAYRPATGVISNLYDATSLSVDFVSVDSNGVLRLVYRDWTGAFQARTGAAGISLTYVV